MSKKRKRLYFRIAVLGGIGILLGYVFYYNFIQKGDTLVVEGDIAPNFQLETLDGETVQLDDYRGQGVFLNFWGTFCPPCEEEMPYMENQYHEFKDEGVEILAVNVGESDLVVDRFVSRHNLTFPVPMDQNKAVLDRYGIGPLPTTFLINKDGEVIDILTGGMTEEDIRGYMERIQPT